MKAEERSEKARAAWARHRAERARLGLPTMGTTMVRAYREDVEAVRRFANKSPLGFHALLEAAELVAWTWDSRRECFRPSMPTAEKPAGLPRRSRLPGPPMG